MAELGEQDRFDVWAEIMRSVPVSGVSKPELRAAVNAVDTWLEANQASLNAALPTAARNNLTVPQKAALLMFVIQQRYVRS